MMSDKIEEDILETQVSVKIIKAKETGWLPQHESR